MAGVATREAGGGGGRDEAWQPMSELINEFGKSFELQDEGEDGHYNGADCDPSEPPAPPSRLLLMMILLMMMLLMLLMLMVLMMLMMLMLAVSASGRDGAAVRHAVARGTPPRQVAAETPL
mmetsp:Transcript_47776/g.102992  ORF Transcript_47776/g.102992 Transcript_47776/m.102992 type:complete len:121 (-) Transcript_47776:302-664(-)